MTVDNSLPHCVALRIALAARQLPDTSSGQLLRILLAALDEPLTEIKLNGLTVKDLKNAADGSLREIDGALLRQALSTLKAKTRRMPRPKSATPALSRGRDAPFHPAGLRRTAASGWMVISAPAPGF